MILDLHIHTRYSTDSLNKPIGIIQAAQKSGLTGVAITDHETIAGALAVKAANTDPEFVVIIGCEVNTELGDLIGLFLNDEIRSRRSVDVVAEIHDQGGLVVLPHPYVSHHLTEALIQSVDLIEIFNARVSPAKNEAARELAESHHKPVTVGSDAHFLREVGLCRVRIPDTDIKGTLLGGGGEFQVSYTSTFLKQSSQIIKAWRTRNFHKVPRHLAAMVIKPFRRRQD